MHWVYRLEGHRKCWFQAEGIATVKKAVHRTAQHRIAGADENGTVPAKGNALVDARAELLRSTPSEASKPRSLVSQIQVADAASVLGAGTAASMPAAPVADPRTDLRTPDLPEPRQVDVEKLLAAAPATGDAASVSAAMPVGLPVTEPGDEGWDWTATWFGTLLMTLGLVSVLSSSRAVREAALQRH